MLRRVCRLSSGIGGGFTTVGASLLLPWRRRRKSWTFFVFAVTCFFSAVMHVTTPRVARPPTLATDAVSRGLVVGPKASAALARHTRATMERMSLCVWFVFLSLILKYKVGTAHELNLDQVEGGKISRSWMVSCTFYSTR